MRAILAGLCALLLAQGAQAAGNEERAARLFDSLAGQTARLRLFLKQMPKGGDLHNHLSGSPYAEDYLGWAAERGWCVDVAARAIAPPPCTAPGRAPAAGIGARDAALYREMVDALSMRGHLAGVGANERSGHDQMFGTFGHFGTMAREETARSIATTLRTAAGDRVSYVELMDDPPTVGAFTRGAEDPAWRDGEFAAAFDRVRPLLPPLVVQAKAETDRTVAQARAALACGVGHEEPACAVSYRFILYGLRSLPLPKLFRQLALLFAIAAEDPRFVAVNLVEPEDWPASVANYAQTMRMVAFLRARFPGVRVTLHAGELAPGLVPPAALADHIAQAVTIAGAQRIGHGTDIAGETDAPATLARMARDHVAVEINLASNDEILGVRGAAHPLNLYRAAGVPVALATDDEGVLRTDMTEQYLRAATEHGLHYADLKRIARDSLTYSFLPGASLWTAAGCADLKSQPCEAFARTSDKARAQRALERDFATFEAAITATRF